MSAYEYLCPEMDFLSCENFRFEESIFVSRLPAQIFSEDNLELRNHLEAIFKRYGESSTFHYLPSVSKVCVVFHRPGEAPLAREELDKIEFLDYGCIKVESLSLISTPWDQRFLKVPKSERRFLLSPPSSPPVGWEPIEESPPVSVGALESALFDLAHTPGDNFDLYQPENPSFPTIRLETVFLESDQSDYSLSVSAVRTSRPSY